MWNLREGWEELDEPFKTNVDGPFKWEWIIVRKDVEKGDVILQLENASLDRKCVLFVFKSKGGDAAVAQPNDESDDKPTASGKKPPKGLFQSKVVEFTDKADPTFIFKEAKNGTAIESDKNYLLTKMPNEMSGGSLVLRDSGRGGPLPALTVRALKDCKAFVVVRWKYLGKVVVDEGAFAKLEKHGWKEAGEVKMTFPAGEDWRWKAYSIDVPKGDVILNGDSELGRQAMFYVFR